MDEHVAPAVVVPRSVRRGPKITVACRCGEKRLSRLRRAVDLRGVRADLGHDADPARAVRRDPLDAAALPAGADRDQRGRAGRRDRRGRRGQGARRPVDRRDRRDDVVDVLPADPLGASTARRSRSCRPGRSSPSSGAPPPGRRPAVRAAACCVAQWTISTSHAAWCATVSGTEPPNNRPIDAACAGADHDQVGAAVGRRRDQRLALVADRLDVAGASVPAARGSCARTPVRADDRRRSRSGRRRASGRRPSRSPARRSSPPAGRSTPWPAWPRAPARGRRPRSRRIRP